MTPELHFGGAPEYAAAGACYLCRTAPDGVWVRTFHDIEYEGELVFCEGCISHLASLLGYAKPEVLDELEETIAVLTEQVDLLAVKAEGFDMFVRKLEESREPVVPDTPARPSKSRRAARTQTATA